MLQAKGSYLLITSLLHWSGAIPAKWILRTHQSERRKLVDGPEEGDAHKHVGQYRRNAGHTWCWGDLARDKLTND